MQTQEKNMMQTANYLQADSEAKELLLIAPTIAPQLSNFGGDEIPKAIVIIQNYEQTRTETSATGEYKQVSKQMMDEVTGKPKFTLVPVKNSDGSNKVDSDGNEIFNRVPVMSAEKVWRQIRQRGNSNTVQTLNVLPCKVLAIGEKLNEVLASGLTDLKTSITTGKPVSIIRIVNGDEKKLVQNVMKVIRKNALCHVYLRIGDKILSTVQVNGGVKGSEFYKDFHGASSAIYRQLKQAETNFDGKPLEIDSSILTALGLTPQKARRQKNSLTV